MKFSVYKHKVPILFFWVAVWQIASILIPNRIIFVGPADVIRSLFLLLPTGSFWSAVGSTLFKISLGFFSAFLSGIFLGGLCHFYHWLRELLEPVISLMKSIPVASFVILALIWIGSENLSIFVSFTVVFPVIFINTLSGFGSTDKKLLEMARVFTIPTTKKIRYIYLPALFPYLKSGCQVALGMSFKSGTAAEVIGVPSGSIGESLYMSKIYLDTSGLFAWTIVIILVASLFERVFLWFLNLAEQQL